MSLFANLLIQSINSLFLWGGSLGWNVVDGLSDSDCFGFRLRLWLTIETLVLVLLLSLFSSIFLVSININIVYGQTLPIRRLETYTDKTVIEMLFCCWKRSVRESNEMLLLIHKFFLKGWLYWSIVASSAVVTRVIISTTRSNLSMITFSLYRGETFRLSTFSNDWCLRLDCC